MGKTAKMGPKKKMVESRYILSDINIFFIVNEAILFAREQIVSTLKVSVYLKLIHSGHFHAHVSLVNHYILTAPGKCENKCGQEFTWGGDECVINMGK